MPSSSSQSRIDRNTYIPPHIAQAMSQHMQQNLPAHMKKYVGQNAAYVPQHMQAQLAQQMQKNMPAHMKQYAGAFMQQKVVQPNTTRLHGPGSGMPQGPRFMTNPKAPDPLRRGHSIPYGEQHTVELNTLPNDKSMFQEENPQPQPEQIQSYADSGQQTAAGSPHHPTYDFIMNPEQPPKKPFLPGSNSSLPVRIGLAAGGLLILLVLFNIVRGLLSGGSSFPVFIAVAQDQQALIHIVAGTTEEQDISTVNKNFAATAELSLSSAQSDLVAYLKKNHQKINVKQLNLKVDPKIDTALETAASAGTYNQTFKEIMQARLNDYISGLQDSYAKAKGPKGRALLKNDYDQAQLLLTQLNSDSTASP